MVVSVAVGVAAAIATYGGVLLFWGPLSGLLPKDYYKRSQGGGCSGPGLNQRGADLMVWALILGPPVAAVVGVSAGVAHDAELAAWPWGVIVAPCVIAGVFHGRHLPSWRRRRQWHKARNTPKRS